ncbi:MAG: DUF922 domain-containing protein [Chloroflexota bacterium]|nr:DUF922 domain-containing protein [Chloroflexota bacterium]
MKDPMRHLVLTAALALVGGSLAPAAVMGADLADDIAPVESPEATAASASLPDLPRRSTPDVPQFVGPARLKVSGRSGAYTWDEFLFGAQEVEVRVAVSPEGESCAMRLRLKEGGEAVVDEWFTAESGAKETHQTRFDVDYLAGSLKVDSDCGAWSVRFVPLEDPRLDVTIEEAYYPVKGDSIDELTAQTDHIKGKWAAYTEWYTSWAYWTEEGEEGSSCDVTHGETKVEVSMTYPNWKRPRDAHPAVVETWQRFVENLEVHELGHVTIALQGADAIDDRLDAGFSASTCKKAGKRADDKATSIFERYARASKRYDKETEHGLSQGTGLD